MGKIKLSEQKLHAIIKESINRIIRESLDEMAYDPNFLDGIDSIDSRSINMFIQSMIPQGNRVSKNSPYKPIRQLVLYFSPEGATKHGGKLTKDIVNFILRDNEMRGVVYEISQADKKILDTIYGENKAFGKDLMQQIVWNLDTMSGLFFKLNDLMDKSNIRNYFSGSEAIDGSSDGKRVGLSTIMYRAFMATNEIKKQIKRMQDLVDKPKDPFGYNTGRFRR